MLKPKASSSADVNQLPLLSILLAALSTHHRPIATKDLSAHLPSILVGPEKPLGHSQPPRRKCINRAILIYRLFLSCLL